jgi:pimeloyl-ACP methyl ester carboxylesterase
VEARSPVVIVGGYISAPESYRRMAAQLAAPPYRRRVFIAPISVADWLFTRDEDFRPLLDTLAATVRRALDATGAAQVHLVGHSAGGRLGRVFLGEMPYLGRVYAGRSLVASLITLGTAHTTQERWIVRFSGFVEQHYPGAFYADVSYRSAVGESVRGRRWGSPAESWAYQSYELVAGQGELTGDGIVPVQSCYLAGADNLVLRGVRHGPYTSRASWYGAPEAIGHWAEGILDSA